MTTKDNGIGMDRGIYASPYDAFANYMNILGDFISRVNSLYPVDMDNEELNSLLTTIKNQDEEMTSMNKELAKLQEKLAKAEAELKKFGGEEKTKAKPKKKPAVKKD